MPSNYVTTSAPAVQIIAPDTAGIPAALKAERRWITWRAEARPNGRIEKIPCDALDGWTCNANDEANWGTFAEAWDTYERCQMAGVGFALDDDSAFVGIDLDHCVDAAGEIAAWAREIIATIDSYSERSPSGAGIRIFARGGLPRSGTKAGDLEMYTGGRFLTVTGRHLDGTPPDVEHRDDEVRDVYMEHCRTSTPTAPEADDLDFSADEPPVHLEAIDRELWDGKRCSRHPDGTVHRSLTLYAIGMMLARYGCTRWVIAQAVADRDTTLGYAKYSGRNDDREYRRIAARTWTKAREDVRLVGKNPEERRLKAQLAQAREKIERLEKEMAERDRHHTLAFRAIKGAGVDDPKERIPAGERITHVAAVWACEEAEAKGKVGADGFTRVYLGAIADTAGCAIDTASRHLKQAEARGLLERRTVTNDATGKTELYIKLAASPTETLEALAQQRREEREPVPVKACADHPEAVVIRRWSTVCADCGQVIDSGEERIDPHAESEPYPLTELVQREPSTFCRPCTSRGEPTIDKKSMVPPVAAAPSPAQGLGAWF